MADRINVSTAQFDLAERALELLRGKADDATELMAAIAGVMDDASQRAFINQRDPETGEPWQPLTKHTANRRVRGQRRGERPILQVTGALRKIQSDFGPDFATVGSPLIYAATQFFGAKRGQYGTASGAYQFDRAAGDITTVQVPIPFGDIPARPFLGLDEDDLEEILDFGEQFFTDI